MESNTSINPWREWGHNWRGERLFRHSLSGYLAVLRSAGDGNIAVYKRPFQTPFVVLPCDGTDPLKVLESSYAT